MLKLLFIDDDISVRRAIEMVFKTKPNYQLFLAGSGQEAIQITKDKKPDLALLDMLMPDMPGEEVFRKLKEINPQIKVIFLTGMEKETVAEKAKKLGAKGYLTKPFDMFALEDYFKEIVPELY